ncbi:hypothetical protein [uncultured Propionibacterium sp.]|uniref:hypothetical protein n=1 Tax=uncultured Propionibacterium sp. TaxID=218066 RepID=UPI00292F1CC0|nr:hypothetical protein [uncultured Propionibacterium sp.]
MPIISGHRNEAVPQPQQGPAPGSSKRRRVPPKTLRLDADIVRISPASYRLYGPGRTCIEMSGRFAEHLAGALHRLDGTVTLDGACRGLRPDEQELLEGLLGRLLSFRMVHKQAYRPGPARIGVIGEGACAERIRHALAVAHRVRGFTEPLPPRGGQSPRPPRRRSACRLDRLEHWMGVNDARLDLIVVAGSKTTPDPVLPWLLSRLGVPHLIITAHHRNACVGPLVQPGVTSCAFCATGSVIDRSHQRPTQAAPTPAALDWTAAITRSVCAAYLDEGIVSPAVEFGGNIWSSKAPQEDCPICARSAQPVSADGARDGRSAEAPPALRGAGASSRGPRAPRASAGVPAPR